MAKAWRTKSLAMPSLFRTEVSPRGQRCGYDFFESEISPIGIVLDDVLRRMAYDHSTLGPFSFPPPETLAQALASEEITDEDTEELTAEVEAA